VLGMLEGTKVTVVNRKKKGAMIIKIRGTRFAVGQSITEHVEVEAV
jgi:ferrous iron transport protein A